MASDGFFSFFWDVKQIVMEVNSLYLGGPGPRRKGQVSVSRVHATADQGQQQQHRKNNGKC